MSETPLELLGMFRWGKLDAKIDTLPPRIPPPQHRHSTPSGPWPWQDIDLIDGDGSEESSLVDVPESWFGYPQNRFPNWLPPQVARSGITKAIEKRQDVPCVVYYCDVMEDGRFGACGKESVTKAKDSKDRFWTMMQLRRPPNNHVRVLCVEDMSGAVLQMLGTKYNIEPFFFSSSLNWIPSRFQEDVRPMEGDHVTITLTFLRTMPKPAAVHSKFSLGEIDQVIDTQSPLFLRSTIKPEDDKVLLLDLMAVHMIRKSSATGSSTIITYHPEPAWGRTTAKGMHSRVKLAGESVYWSKIFDKTSDPTFVLLTILWHALYLWDQALSTLYAHICWLESMVIRTNDMSLTQSLHIIRAHLLHYASLLEDFKKSVVFVLETPNPAMEAEEPEMKARSRALLEKECHNLLSEIERLEQSRAMQNKRLKNVMNLVFSAAAVRDSAAMKQISYLTMIFLPASFVSGVFGMNIREINPGTYGSILHYTLTAIPFTLLTIWIIVAFQSKRYLGRDSASLWSQLGWPVHMITRHLSRRVHAPDDPASDITHSDYITP